MPDRIAAWGVEEGDRRVRALYAERLGGEPATVGLAPGRVNLIGEHTDYNAGLCLPIALPHATYVAATPRDDGRFRLVSDGEAETWEGGSDDLGRATGWAAYAAGVLWALGEAGHPSTGLDLAVTGCVPLGAGLSSSASLECSVGTVAAAVLGLEPGAELDRLLVAAGIRAENEVAGAATGGMDQTVAVHGRRGHALLLDFRSGGVDAVPFDPAAAGLALLVIDTRVNHALNDGGYASRRADCVAAAETLGVDTLREATPADLDRITDERVRRRARHIVTEIERVAAFVDVVGAGEWSAAGDLMVASHASMRDDFEISVPELDLVVETAMASGAVGARMTGGGFGGSAIALVPVDRADHLRAAVDAAFDDQGWSASGHLDAPASDAARIVT